VTERRAHDEAQRQSEAQARLLLAELQHRVRNTLAVVRSIARRTAMTSTSVDDYSLHLDGRLNAFARVQAEVTRNPQEGISLEQLLAEELHSHGAREGEHVEELEGMNVRFPPKAAELIGAEAEERARKMSREEVEELKQKLETELPAALEKILAECAKANWSQESRKCVLDAKTLAQASKCN
jgi:hypothetical protein